MKNEAKETYMNFYRICPKTWSPQLTGKAANCVFIFKPVTS